MPKFQFEWIKGSDFELFDSIINGRHRPFLPEYSNEENVKKLFDDFNTLSFYVAECETSGCPTKGFKLLNEADIIKAEILIKPYDIIKFEIDENEEPMKGTLTNITNDTLEELIDFDFPPPETLKAEYFFSLIEFEFKKIKLNARNILKTATSEQDLSLHANKNIQRLKEIAVQAHLLSKRLRTKGRSIWDDPDSYTIYILKEYIIRSIFFYQGLFQPYLKVPIQDEYELRTSLYGEQPIQDAMRDFENRQRNLQRSNLYKGLSNEALTLKKGDDTKPDYDIAALKILTLTGEWLNTAAKEAISNGFIGLSHLVFIMAKDENYTKDLILIQLIENMFSEMKECRDIPLLRYSELSTSDYKSRIDVWHALTNHWKIRNSRFYKDKCKNFLSFYCLNPITKDLERFNSEQKCDQLTQERLREKSDKLTIKEHVEIGKIVHNIARFVKLSELKKYLGEVLGIPLPSALFPDNVLFYLDDENKVKNLRPSQKAKIKCRKIAKEIWSTNPKMTIADMINQSEMLPYTEKKDGTYYIEKTIRDWMHIPLKSATCSGVFRPPIPE